MKQFIKFQILCHFLLYFNFNNTAPCRRTSPKTVRKKRRREKNRRWLMKKIWKRQLSLKFKSFRSVESMLQILPN